MTATDAMVMLDRGFEKLVNPKAKPGDIRHRDTLNEIMNAIRPACFGHVQAARIAPRQKTAAEIDAENEKASKSPVCLKCKSMPCECTPPPSAIIMTLGE